MNEKEAKETLSRFAQSEYPRMRAYVRKQIGSIDVEPEDIIQDVFLSISAMPDLLLPFTELSSYVYRSLKNRIIDHFRKKKEVSLALDAKYEEGNASLHDIVADNRFAVESFLEKEEDARMFHLALDSLPALEKDVIVATEFESKRFADLALEWDTPIGTLLSRKSRAMKKIKKYLLEKRK